MELFKRYTLACLIGLGVTSGLLYVMQGLIRSEAQEVDEPRPSPTLEFVSVIDEPPLVEKDRKPKKPPKVEKQPPAPLEVATDSLGATEIGIEYSKPVTPGIPTIAGRSNADFIPMLTVAPDYPRRAREQGTEGYVVVEYTVDTLGRVKDAHVLYSQPSSVFDRAALKAVQRYKYKPRLREGAPVDVHGVRQKIVFEMET